MIPKKEKVFIGEKEFEIGELTCVKRNALLDIVGSFTFAEMMKSVYPVLNELGIKLNEGNEDENIGKLIKLGLQNEALWGVLMACFIDVLHIGPQVIFLSLCDSVEEEVEDYIASNLTVTQEPVILQKIIEINKLPDTVKNYRSLLTEIRAMMKTNS
jgi:hypothetical protein